MTHSWGAFDDDESTRRVKSIVSRLNRVIGQLEYQQINMPHIADSLQPKIDKLTMQRDSYANKLRECKCGCIRGDHINNKCPFAATTFVDKWDIRNY